MLSDSFFHYRDAGEDRRQGAEVMTETRIYVGLNDSETREQVFETEKYVKLLRDVCYAYKTPFSFDVEEGGYVHEDGEYTREKTLVLTLVDVGRETAEEIAKDLCAFFNQESVMVTEHEVNAYFVSESI